MGEEGWREGISFHFNTEIEKKLKESHDPTHYLVGSGRDTYQIVVGGSEWTSGGLLPNQPNSGGGWERRAGWKEFLLILI